MSDWMLVLMPLLAVPVVLLFRFVGCASFTAAEAEAVPDFEISLSSSTTSVNQGQNRDVTVTITSLNGFSADTALATSGLANVSAAFSPNSVKPAPGATATSKLTFTAFPNAAAGSTMVTITATAAATAPGTGQLVHSLTLNLTVIAPAVPDFSLSLTPPSRSVARGQTGSFTVNVTRLGGFPGAVALAVTPAPPGAGFSPNPATGNTSTLTVPIPNNAPVGTFPFTVTGTSGSLQRTANGTVVVT